MLDIHTVFEYNIHMMNTFNKHRFICIIFSLFFLFIGLLIYLFLRKGTYIHSFLPENIELKLADIYLRTYKSFFCDLLRFYIVDFMWGAGLAFALCSVLHKIDFAHIIYCSVFSFILGILYETLQYFSVLSGTFDLMDICMYAVAASLCSTINIKFISRRSLWKNHYQPLFRSYSF